jgi:tetratricopeptide (TPR) repeat protein
VISRSTAIVLLAVILGLSGCAREVREAGGSSGSSGAYDNPATWLRAAKLHEEQGDLQRALYEYRLAKTVSRSDGSIRNHLHRVEKEIEQRTAALLKQAERADARGQQKKARRLYLEILGLQPDHRQALAALREQEKQRSLRGVKKQRELARRNRSNGRKSKDREAYTDEGYVYSRQAILEAVSRPADAESLLQELGKHQHKYPKDEELRRQLIEMSLARAEKAYQAQRWDNALQYLNLAERACTRVEGQRDAVDKARKHYARELYNRGVITFRNDPQEALGFWKYALKFDPDDDKSRLRIRSLTRK